MNQEKCAETESKFWFCSGVVCLSGKSEVYPSVSVIIVNFNSRDLLMQCLTSLLKSDYPNFDVFVIDNASTDGSLAEAKKHFGSDSHVKLVGNSKNVGHSEGCNIGVRMSESKYIVFLDADIAFENSNWLRELVKVMENDASVGLAQAKLVVDNDKQCLDCVCVAIDALGTWAANYGSKADALKENFEILAASSGCSIIRREVFSFAGGFDPDYFIYDDDTDLSLRVRLLGYRVIFVSSAVVIHRGGVLRGVSGTMLYYSSKNRLATVLKNYQLRNVWWRFSVLAFFTLMVSTGFFIAKKHEEAKATLDGLLNPLMDLPKIWRKRLIFQSKRRINDSELVKGGFVRNDFQSTIQDFKIKLAHME